MSSNLIKDRIQAYVDTADNHALERLFHFIEHEAEEGDWWNDISDAHKASIRKGHQQAMDGNVLSHEEVKQRYPQRFRK